jgi:hypothetical protein
VCIVALLIWLLLVVALGLVLILPVVRPDVMSAEKLRGVLGTLFAAGTISGGLRALLWIWPLCERCKRPLFREGRRRPFFAGQQPWARSPDYLHYEPERDYRAKTLLGAFSTRSMFDAAIGGAARCQWCGHMDGQKPEYQATIAS